MRAVVFRSGADLGEPLDVPTSHGQQTICRVGELLRPHNRSCCIYATTVLCSPPWRRTPPTKPSSTRCCPRPSVPKYARRVQALRSRNTLLAMLEDDAGDAGHDQARSGQPRWFGGFQRQAAAELSDRQPDDRQRIPSDGRDGHRARGEATDRGARPTRGPWGASHNRRVSSRSLTQAHVCESHVLVRA